MSQVVGHRSQQSLNVATGGRQGIVTVRWAIATSAPSFVLALVQVLVYLGAANAEGTDFFGWVPLLFAVIVIGPILVSVAASRAQVALFKRHCGDIDGGAWVILSTGGWIISALVIVFAGNVWVQNFRVYGEQIGVYATSNLTLYTLSLLGTGLVTGSLIGLIIGAIQNQLLRKLLPGIHWIAANVVGFGLGGTAGMYMGMIFLAVGGAPAETPLRQWLGVLALPACLVIASLVTGTVLARHLRNASQNDSRGV